MASQAMQSLPSDLLEVDWELLGSPDARSRQQYHWYPQAGRREVAGVLIGCLSSQGSHVLDPFCGTGSTMAEAWRQKRWPIGGDINPVASLITTARLISIDPSQWDSYITSLRQRVTERLVVEGFATTSTNLKIPCYEENRCWYHELTLVELGAIWQAIHDIPHVYGPIAEASFSAILRSVSSRRGPANRIADNIHPEVLTYRSAVEPFFSRLAVYRRDSNNQHFQNSESGNKISDPEIWTGSSQSILRLLPDNTVDLAVTQLPEPGVTDYVRSQRLSFLWFGWNMKDYDVEEVGARFKRHRSDALTEYLDGIDSVFNEMARVIKPGAWSALVLGPTICKDRLSDELSRMLALHGLATAGRFSGRKRGRSRASGRQPKREEIIVAWKDG